MLIMILDFLQLRAKKMADVMSFFLVALFNTDENDDLHAV